MKAMGRMLTVIASIGWCASPLAADVQVRLQTSAGAVDIELYPHRAPITVANFLALVDGGHYQDGSFYRTVTPENDNGSPKIRVIQGGRGDLPPPFPPIAHESTADTGIPHTDGAVSMARGAVGSAASEFFICIGDQPGLDHGGSRYEDRAGFAAFGRVTRGMDVVRAINSAATREDSDSAYTKGQMLTEPVRILSVTRLPKAGGRLPQAGGRLPQAEGS